MAEQLTFELADPPPATLETFVPGRNAEVVDVLARAARHEIGDGIVLWGAQGVGKTHLLSAVVAAARASGREAHGLADPSLVADIALGAGALVAVDCVDAADARAEAGLFTLYNALASCGGQLVCASRVPPARMSLRDDIRTRLGWGLVYEVVALADADKPDALRAYARARGFALSGEVVDYLLAHGRRDMGSLVHALTALDRHSLAMRRPITVPLIRDWLQAEMGLTPREQGPVGMSTAPPPER
jgi:DnaA family protein